MNGNGPPQTPERRSGPGDTREAQLRRMRRRIQMVRGGVTSFALLGGLSCYVLLLQFHLVSQAAALVIGLVFALLVRVAAGSLARDWLQQQIARQDGTRADDARRAGEDAAPPSRRAPRK